MSDNGEGFFYANKQSRQDQFSFKNQGTEDAVTAGDQAAVWHPVPGVLGTTQKVGLGDQEPAPESPVLERTGRLTQYPAGTGNA